MGRSSLGIWTYNELPLAGPFAGLTRTNVNKAVSTTISGGATYSSEDVDEADPAKFNLLRLSGGTITAYAPNGNTIVNPDHTPPTGLFLWVNELNIVSSGTISYNGGAGADGDFGATSGNGGNGTAGGGGGAAVHGTCCNICCCPTTTPGGNGGTGDYGDPGNALGGCIVAGAGGYGNATALVYSFGSGSNGSGDGFGALGGNGINGIGGGGAGGSVSTDVFPCVDYAGGGGGAGGGLVCVVGNLLSGSVGTFSSQGGVGGVATDGVSSGGAQGGAGRIWLAFRHKTGGTCSFSSANHTLYQINADNSLTLRNASDTW